MGRLIVVMGVSGCGKSTIGRALSDRLDCPFIEGDDHHPPANVSKMSTGVPLSDSDRAPWTAAIVAAIDATPRETIVLACSALTPTVQSALLKVRQRDVVWLHLQADKAHIRERMETRDHFMSLSLLDSQYEALEPPVGAVELDTRCSISALIDQIERVLN